jgi:hypothetical protein
MQNGKHSRNCCPPKPRSLRCEVQLDLLMMPYLGVLEAETNSPSAREVADVLESVAQRADQFAQDLYRLDIRASNEGPGAFNTANEAAADILAEASIRGEGRSVLEASLRANQILADFAAREAKRLADSSKKGRRTHGAASAWVLRQLADILRAAGLRLSLPPRSRDPLCVASKQFLKAALTRAKTLRQPEWASTEIRGVLSSNQIFLRTPGHAASCAKFVTESRFSVTF